MRFEPTTTEFCSDALTEWAIRPWVQLALSANFVQLFQFHRLLSVQFHFRHCLCQSQRLFELKFSWSNHVTVAEWYDAYGIHHWRIIRNSYRKSARVGYEPTTTEFLSEALTDWAIRPWVQLAFRANFVHLFQFYRFLSVQFHFGHCLHQSSRLFELKFSSGNLVSVAEWCDTYGIHHWRIIRSSFRKLATVGYKPTTTEFRSDALTVWPFRPWVEPVLRANFVQLLQFHHLLSVHFHFGHCLCQSPRLSALKFSGGNHVSVAEWYDTYGIHHWRIIRSSCTKFAWLIFEPTTTEFRSGVLTEWAIRPWVQLALSATFVQLFQFHRLPSVQSHFQHCLHQSQSLFELKFSWGNHVSVTEWYDAYGIHHWRIIWSSYRNLASVGYEPTTTEFGSDTLTGWAITPWVQLALRPNFVQLFQFYRLLSVRFHFGNCVRQVSILFEFKFFLT